MSVGYRAAVAACLLLLASSLPTPAQRDTTIAGQTYNLVAAGPLAEALRRADGRAALVYRRVAVVGLLSAAIAGVDTVRAAVTFSDVCFPGEVALDHVVFLAPVRFERTLFAGGISLLGTSFRKELVLAGGRVQKHFNGKQAVFHDRADFTGTQFEQTASAIGARFEGRETSFANTGFQEGAYFEQASFAGAASFQDAQFEGMFSAKETAWEGDASFAGARFRERTFFWQARFARTARFDAAWLGGETAFSNATFAGPALFRQVHFVRPVHFQGVSFLDQASFAGSRFQDGADFLGAQFAGWAGMSASFAGLLDLRQITTPVLDLRPRGDPRSGAGDSLFASGARVYMQGASYDKILVRWNHLAGRLAAPDSADVEALAPVYAALRQQLRAHGLERDADACRAEWLERRRQALPWTAPHRYALQLLDLTSRYGTDLRRLGLFCLVAALLFAGLYRLLGLAEGSHRLSLAACAYYSFSAFLGSPPFHPAGRLRLLVLGEALVSWVAWGLFVVTAIGLLGG